MSEVTVTLSDRLTDIDRVIAVVHDGFVDAGYMPPHPAGRRAIPHYLTPGAAFALAEVDGEPVGSCVCIPDGPWGLPSEHAFPTEVAALRARVRPLMEVGSLAIPPAHRALTRRVVTRLFAVAIRVLREEDRDVVVSMSPEQERFYRGLVGLSRVAGPVPLLGAPALLMHASSADMVEHLAIGTAISRRHLHELVADEDPSWLVDRRVGVLDRLVATDAPA